jgi:hypothetical protein
MSQIFHHTANTYAKMSLVIVGLGLGFAGWALDQASRSEFTTGAMQAHEQPVPFSHAHHVGGLGFDCRYCHTSVENSSFANIPPTKTCMNCHSQIWSTSPTLEPVRASFRDNQSIQWTRVHDLPDFVYFNHSIHVNKGVGCETCHGRVDQMPLTWQQNSLQMEWCLNCHRNTEQYLRPREFVTKMGYEPAGDQLEIGRKLHDEYKIQDVRTLTSCSTCHR